MGLPQVSAGAPCAPTDPGKYCPETLIYYDGQGFTSDICTRIQGAFYRLTSRKDVISTGVPEDNVLVPTADGPAMCESPKLCSIRAIMPLQKVSPGQNRRFERKIGAVSTFEDLSNSGRQLQTLAGSTQSISGRKFTDMQGGIRRQKCDVVSEKELTQFHRLEQDTAMH